MSFDAAKTAQTMENLAKESIDKSDSIQASVKLADQWMALTPQQRIEVGKELEKQFDNSLPNTMPRPKMELNDKGECIGIDFAASSMDFFSKKDNLRVASFSPDRRPGCGSTEQRRQRKILQTAGRYFL